MRTVPIRRMRVASMLDEDTINEGEYLFRTGDGDYIALLLDDARCLHKNEVWREIVETVTARTACEGTRVHAQAGRTVQGQFKYWLVVFLSGPTVVAAGMRVSVLGEEMLYSWVEGIEEAVDVEFAFA